MKAVTALDAEVPLSEISHSSKSNLVSLTLGISKFEDQISHRKQLANLLKIPLDFCYFLFCSPSRLKLQKCQISGQEYFVVRNGNLLHKVLCVALTFLDCLCMFQLVRESFPGNSKNPTMHFIMWEIVIGESLKIVMIKKLWMHQNEFATIANFVLNQFRLKTFSPLMRTPKNILTVGATLISVIYTLVGIQNWMGRARGREFHFNPSLWIEQIRGRNIFFLPKNNKNLKDSYLDFFLSALASAGYFHRFDMNAINFVITSKIPKI